MTDALCFGFTHDLRQVSFSSGPWAGSKGHWPRCGDVHSDNVNINMKYYIISIVLSYMCLQLCLRPQRGSAPGRRWGTSVPRPPALPSPRSTPLSTISVRAPTSTGPIRYHIRHSDRFCYRSVILPIGLGLYSVPFPPASIVVVVICHSSSSSSSSASSSATSIGYYDVEEHFFPVWTSRNLKK